jgi:hypothetical protein
MQETDHRVNPDNFSLLEKNLFAYLKDIGVLPSLEFTHISPRVFAEDEQHWLRDNNYETILLSGNSVQHWLDYKKRNPYANVLGSIQLNYNIPEELREFGYWPTEVALNRDELFIPGTKGLSLLNQIAKIPEWRNEKQIPQSIVVKAPTLPQSLDLVMNDFQKSVLRQVFGRYFDHQRTRIDSSIEGSSFTIGLVPESYRTVRITAEKDTAEREKLALIALLFPGSDQLQLAA